MRWRNTPSINFLMIKDYENLGYPFYIKITKDRIYWIMFTYKGRHYEEEKLYLEIPFIEVIKINNWLPIAKKKSLYQITKEREEIIRIAQQKLAEKDVDDDDWDSIPF